jgi:hypothetical protein
MAYAMPIPGAPLYEYAKMAGIIGDEDKYLEMISGKTTDRPYCNLTQVPDGVLMSWKDRVRREVDSRFFGKRLHSRALGRLAEVVLGRLYSMRNLYKQGTLYQGLRDKCRAIFKQWKSEGDTSGGDALPSAKKGIPGIDDIFADIDQTKRNRNASLRAYNRRVGMPAENMSTEGSA